MWRIQTTDNRRKVQGRPPVSALLPGPALPAKGARAVRVEPPSQALLDALESADGVILTLSASAAMHRHLSIEENAVLELAIEREAWRQRFREEQGRSAVVIRLPHGRV